MSDKSSFILHPSSFLMRTLRPYLMLLVLALIAFWPLVLHPTQTLYSNSSDLLAQHLPAKYFLVRSLRETGELPLWNPEQYSGSPFVHDIQVGLFYPPHLPLYFISEPAIGPFVSWLLFVHVLLAGWFMYAYARHAGMSELAAFVAGVGFMLSPRWMMQLFLAGHVVTQGICWLPLVMLCVERAIQRKRWSWAVGGGVAYAMLILGTHPQWTFYASLLIGAWPLRLLSQIKGEPGASATGERQTPVANAPGSPRQVLCRWLAVETIVVLIGVSLCAAQLFPTYEAAGQSSRASGMGQSWSLDGAKFAMQSFIGPDAHWEANGGIGLLWAALAILAIGIGGRSLKVPTLITFGILIYVFGGSILIDRLPGFSSFRMPTRMLLTLAFPVAFLAGCGMDLLRSEATRRNLWWATILALVLAIPAIWFRFEGLYGVPLLARTTTLYVFLYWAFALCSAFAFFRIPERLLPNRRWLVGLLLIGELLIISPPLADAKKANTIYQQSTAFDYLSEHNLQYHRVYDPEPRSHWEGSMIIMRSPDSLLGPGSPNASVWGIPSIRGYNPLDVPRYRQFLAIIADEEKTEGAFTNQFSHPVVLALSAREPIRHRRLLDLLGVRYIVTKPDDPRLDSGWSRVFHVQGVYSYNFLGSGIKQIYEQTIFENQSLVPRAFVLNDAVPEADSKGVASQLQSLDVRQTATLEAWDPTRDPLPRSTNPTGPAKLRSHKPNEIIIDLDGKTAGLLVLTDPWYPGWVCRIDGNEVPIWKADYAFRGVMVPEGSREVVFHFEPQSYRRGKWISLAALVFVLLLGIAHLVARVRQKR